jgi:hypothetical protein
MAEFGWHMRVTLLKFIAPLEQFSRARVGLATHRTATLENTDVPWLALTFTAARLGFEAQNAAAVQLLRLAGGIPTTGAYDIVPVPPADTAPAQVAVAPEARHAAAPKKRHAAKSFTKNRRRFIIAASGLIGG